MGRYSEPTHTAPRNLTPRSIPRYTWDEFQDHLTSGFEFDLPFDVIEPDSNIGIWIYEETALKKIDLFARTNVNFQDELFEKRFLGYVISPTHYRIIADFADRAEYRILLALHRLVLEDQSNGYRDQIYGYANHTPRSIDPICEWRELTTLRDQGIKFFLASEILGRNLKPKIIMRGIVGKAPPEKVPGISGGIQHIKALLKIQ